MKIRPLVYKIEELVFYFFIFSIPFQRRLILYQKDWYFNEWRSISVFSTDILLGILFLFWLVDRRHRAAAKFHNTIADLFLLMFLMISAISINHSSERWISVYHFLKLAELVLFYFYIKRYAIKIFDLNYALIAFIVSAVFQSLLGIVQFLRQSDLGIRFVGEGLLRPSFHGVAVFYNSVGTKIMRAYGTTPHPNILAAFLFVALFALYYLYLNDKSKTLAARFYFIFFYVIILFGFFMTFSRTIIFTWAAGVVVLAVLFYKKYPRKIKNIMSTTILIVAAFGLIFWPEILSRLTISTGDEAISLRVFYAREALKSGFKFDYGPFNFLAPVINLNWTGVGIGNFVTWFMKASPHLPNYLYQPVHNIYLLVYSEMGILGILFFGLFLWFLVHDHWRKRPFKLGKSMLFIVFFGMLFIGLFDHFPWTLQQGQIIFWLITGLVASL